MANVIKVMNARRMVDQMGLMLQVTSSLVVTSNKINACSVYTQQAYLRAVRVSVAPRPRSVEQKNADVTSSLPN